MRKDPTDPDNLPRIFKSDQIYAGRIVTVRRDELAFSDGRTAAREVVETADAVAIVAIDGQGRACLIRQYRHPQRAYVWEIPAGRVDVPGEDPLATAKRELLEEAQLASDNWSLLAVTVSSPGFATERTHIFLATGVQPAAAPSTYQPSAEEQEIQKDFRPIEALLRDIDEGKLTDAKTLIGIFLADARRRAV